MGDGWQLVKKPYWWRRDGRRAVLLSRRTSRQRQAFKDTFNAQLRLFLSKTRGRCFHCLAQDHKAVVCRDLVKCFLCLPSGYRASFCCHRQRRPPLPVLRQRAPPSQHRPPQAPTKTPTPIHGHTPWPWLSSVPRTPAQLRTTTSSTTPWSLIEIDMTRRPPLWSPRFSKEAWRPTTRLWPTKASRSTSGYGFLSVMRSGRLCSSRCASASRGFRCMPGGMTSSSASSAVSAHCSPLKACRQGGKTQGR